MAYLEEFKRRIANNDFSRFLHLWEEYVLNDVVDVPEFIQLLTMIKGSEISKSFSKYAETALPMWELIQDKDESYEVLRLIIDLQSSNTAKFGELALKALETKHGDDPQFKERLRLVGLRSMENFQGALSNYELLVHLVPGKFVYHTGGWGTGEVFAVSPVLQQVTIEFENVSGKREVSFENAFKTVIPLADEHFFARRFGNPDQLEQEAREKPQEVIRLLLRDLGPKNAAEIKNELAEWVIPENEWSKWWQSARAKIKKDTFIDSPSHLKDPFRLHLSEVTHEDRLKKDMHEKTELVEIFQTTYNYIRDYPNMLRNEEVRESIKEKITGLLSCQLTVELELQIAIFLEQMLDTKIPGKEVKDLIQNQGNLVEVVNAIEIQALKKRALIAVKNYRSDWVDLFFAFLFSTQQNTLRDYLFDELNKDASSLLKEKISELLQHPERSPALYIWYFQKALSDREIPCSDKEGQCQCLESLLILLNKIEAQNQHRDLVKKIYSILTGNRYATIRSIIEGSTFDFIKEFLLLISKCQTLSDHDIKIMRSLAEVAHPSLSGGRKKSRIPENVIWTTEEGYLKIQDRIKHIGTTEMVEVAKDIEVARAHGDLRENAEYKAALEKRARLQAELKTLSDQFHRARIISKDDISSQEVTVGGIVELKDEKGNKIMYSILGPWDANPERNILSFRSKLAETMIGHKIGDTFDFNEEKFTVVDIKSHL